MSQIFKLSFLISFSFFWANIEFGEGRECWEGDSKYYSGKTFMSSSGHVCKFWANKTAEHQVLNGYFPDESLADASNYCRSPDNDSGGPWCFVDGNGSSRQYCNVPRCSGVCCPTLRVTATGPAKTEQSTRLGTYEYHKLGSNGKEVFKQIGGQEYIYFESTFREWMIGKDYTSTIRGITQPSCKNEICPSSCSSEWKYYDSGWKVDTTIQVECDWSTLVEKDKNLEQKLKKLEENLNELKLVAESNSRAINDTLIPDVIENFKKSEDIQREVDENHDKKLELKTNEWEKIGAGFCMDAFGSYFNDLETYWKGSCQYNIDECKVFCEQMEETCVGIVFYPNGNESSCSLNLRNGVTEEDAKALVPNFCSSGGFNNFHYNSTGGVVEASGHPVHVCWAHRILNLDVSGSGTNEDFSSCKDKKVWCKMADCSLITVAKNCQKTCGAC